MAAALDPAAHRELVYKRIGWVACFLAWLFLAVSLVSFDRLDPPAPGVVPHNQPAHNLCGIVGAYAAHSLYQLVGLGVWVLMALAAAALVITAIGRSITHLSVRVIGALLLCTTVACTQSLVAPTSGPVASLGGGLLGTVVTQDVLLSRFGPVGTVLFLILALVVASIVALDVWAMLFAMWTGRLVYAGAKHTGRIAGQAAMATAATIAERRAQAKAAREAELARRAAMPAVRDHDLDDPPPTDVRALKEVKPAKGSARTGKAAAPIDPTLGGLGATERFNPDGAGLTPGVASAELEDEEEIADPDEPQNAGPSGDDEDDADEAEQSASSKSEPAAPASPKVFTPEELRAKIAKLPVRFSAQSKRSATEADLQNIQNQQGMELEGYRFPGVDLLEEPETNFGQTQEAFVREQATALERALKEYKIDGEVVGVESGPVITLYELRLAPGTKVAALSAISSDLARALKAVNIRIVSNMVGRDTVGVEVPNAVKEKVRLKELMTKSEIYAGMRLPMFLGKDASGEPMIEDLAKMPHMLIAGTTGSGKSVCMNTIIMSFLYTKKPSELKLVLVDPKMVEMSQFKDIPHLMCPVVTEMSKAAAILEWAVNKMDERYELLAEAGCRDIATYNELTWEEIKERFNPQTPEEEARIPRKLPYMVFVIDELADLMMTNKEVEHSIVRIAQKARAVGMHLILATQRPQANVVTGLIKSNMPARCAFKVASGMDSRIVLDQKGGELLLGQGDMLYLSPKSSKLTRAQGTLVDDKEIRRVVKFMREVATPTFERQLMQLKGTTIADGDEASAEDLHNGLLNAQDDPLFDKAVEIVLETKRGSVSMLQRHLAIGYTRAARLIEMMGEAGILGEHKGTVAREVAITLEEWHAMKAQAKADAEEAEKNPSKPIAPTLEQAQSIVNDGNLKESLEERSAAKATEDLEDSDEEIDEDDVDDEGAEDEEAPEPPFEVQVRTRTPESVRPPKAR